MAFETKLRLSDEKFTQGTGDTLTISNNLSVLDSSKFLIDGNPFTIYTGSTITTGDLGAVQLSDGASGFTHSENFYYVPSTNFFKVSNNANTQLSLTTNLSHSMIQGEDHVVGDGIPFFRWNAVFSERQEFFTGQTTGTRRIQNNLFGGFNNDTYVESNGIFGSLVWGTNNILSGRTTNSVVLGRLNVLEGLDTSYSTLLGVGAKSTSLGSLVYGHYTNIDAVGSLVGGEPTKVLGEGRRSINLSSNSLAQPAGYGILSDYSTIINGIDNHIGTGNTGATILGGNTIQITGTGYQDHVIAPNLTIWNTPSNGTSSDDILVRDSSSKQIKSVTQSSIIDNNLTASQGLTLSAGDVQLGGNLTQTIEIFGDGGNGIMLGTYDVVNDIGSQLGFYQMGAGFIGHFSSQDQLNVIQQVNYSQERAKTHLQPTNIENTVVDFNGEVGGTKSGQTTIKILDDSVIPSWGNISAGDGNINLNVSTEYPDLRGSGNISIRKGVLTGDTGVRIRAFTQSSSVIPNIETEIRLSHNEFVFVDNRSGSTKVGVEYLEDLSANYTNRSLPDVEYTNNVGRGQLEILTGATTVSNTFDTTYLVNSPTTGLTITLPASPSDNLKYIFKDAANAALLNNIVIDGNGKNIDGTTTATINTNNGGIGITYSSSLDGWFITNVIN